jgi:protein phosphatase 1B
MGAFLDKPKTDKQTDGGSGNGLRYGVSSMQGWRVEMEDAHLACIGLPAPGLKDWSAFAVFDGHAGGKVSTYCAKHLLDAIIKNEDFNGNDGSSSSNSSVEKHVTLDSVRVGLRTGFLRLDEELRGLPETTTGEDRSGTTVICTLISPNNIIFANCGDSRSVLCREGRVAAATVDHKPVNPVEKDRIQKAGGSVMIQRVNGSLAVSRALGDFEYKNVAGKDACEQLVSPEPEVTIEERSDADEFLVLACDGIWDVMSNEELCDFIRSRMLLTDDLKLISNWVVDTCLAKGSRDNMSIIIVAFKGAPQVSESAKAKEAELNERLQAKVKDILATQPPEAATMQYIMHLLAIEDIDGLPPGGGIYAKRDTVEEIVRNLSPASLTDQQD